MTDIAVKLTKMAAQHQYNRRKSNSRDVYRRQSRTAYHLRSRAPVNTPNPNTE